MTTMTNKMRLEKMNRDRKNKREGAITEELPEPKDKSIKVEIGEVELSPKKKKGLEIGEVDLKPLARSLAEKTMLEKSAGKQESDDEAEYEEETDSDMPESIKKKRRSKLSFGKITGLLGD